VKAVERLERVHSAQVLSYLRFARFPIGLLFNFNAGWLTEDGSSESSTSCLNDAAEMAKPLSKLSSAARAPVRGVLVVRTRQSRPVLSR
jgi:hypothetical protein